MNEKITFSQMNIPLKIGIISSYLFLIGAILGAIGWT